MVVSMVECVDEAARSHETGYAWWLPLHRACMMYVCERIHETSLSIMRCEENYRQVIVRILPM